MQLSFSQKVIFNAASIRHFEFANFWFLPTGCRQAANCGYWNYWQAKNQAFRSAGRLVPPIHVKLGRADGHVGPLACAKFHINRCRRLGMRPPKYQKFPFFGKESPRRDDSLDRFRKFLGDFIRLTILQYWFKFHMIRFTGYGVIAEKPRVGNLGQIFQCTL